MPIKFPMKQVDDTSAKAGNFGKVGLRHNKIKMPENIPAGDFPKEFNIKGKSAKEVKKGSVASMERMNQVKFKEANPDLAGFGAGKLDNQPFRGNRRMQYNPFGENTGFAAQVGGLNEGGDQDVPKKKEKGEAIISARFRLGRRNRKSSKSRIFDFNICTRIKLIHISI